jgi:Bacterial protein of unknown function (DUF899)
MATTPSDPTTALPGRPPVVDLATWQAARDELLVREKAHTREGDAIAAARRRLPMVEFDGTAAYTQARGCFVGGGRSRVRTWVGEADGFIDRRRYCLACADVSRSRHLGTHWT